MSDASIASRSPRAKPPQGLAGAPYVEEQGLDVFAVQTDTVIFEGTAREACKGFPANVNVPPP